MSKQNVINNVAILGNVSHLVSQIVLAVAGNEISNHLNGKEINAEVVDGITLATLNKELGGAKQ